MTQVRGDAVLTALESRLHLAVLWLIVVLVTLDTAGAVYLRALRRERHAAANETARPQAARTPTSNNQWASPESHVTASRLVFR